MLRFYTSWKAPKSKRQTDRRWRIGRRERARLGRRSQAVRPRRTFRPRCACCRA
jgi:hypothetical protein